MSKKLCLLLFGALTGAMVVNAAVGPGENLILNGNLEAEQLEFPQFWSQNPKRLVSYNPTGGPDSVGAVIFSNPEQVSGVASARHHGLRLVAGETYKMSVWVKTNGFESGHCGVIVHNSGWISSQGVLEFPKTTDGWQYLENTFQAEASKDESYGAALFAQNFKGEIQFAKVKLEAISAGALAGSSVSPILAEQNRVRLVPWTPLLNRIPKAAPQMTFHAFGRLTPQTVAEHDCVFTLDGKEWRKSALQPELNVVDLAGVAVGDHRLGVAIVHRARNEEVFALDQTITIVDLPAVDSSSHRPFNNFVTEVLSRDLAPAAAEQRFSFDNPRDGWVYVAVQAPAVDGGLAVRLADLGVVITAATDRAETFRHLPMGRHDVAVTGAATGGKLVVRSIIEIFNYPACANSKVPQNGSYGWDFHVKHVFPAVTTLNGGRIPDENLPEFKERGLRWLANLGTTAPKSAADLVERMEKAAGLNDPKYDGVTCDEQFFGRPNLLDYTEAIRQYANPNDRLIYTWIVGKPSMAGIHNDFISASINASRGRGRLIYEAYCHSRPDEKDATDYLQNRVVDTMDKFVEYFPDAAAGSGILFGNFNQIPIISLDVNPEVDYKYYLDMQLNLVANHPSFKNLATTGYWGSYYDDEELYRWSFQLLRHYCVEGNTTMLSEKYGYTYNPGHLRNCDFLQGLDGWDVAAAAAEAVLPASFAGYGKGAQRRWGAASKTGDTFCLFKRQDGQANVISQKATGLVPGKVYTLQFVTADYQDMLNKRFNPREHGITATLGAGVEVIPEQSYVFVDRRNSGRKKDDGQARVNLHHIRFRATAESFTVTFSDADATPGEELALNYIMMKPYYE
ncbi:MAG: hypothetical protein PHG96_03605 [Kiritimatiellae bacterium]|nr:hypothetical protein [Kiritimatiellia bacterium]